MGADIYLLSVSDACKKRWEAVFKKSAKERDAIKVKMDTKCIRPEFNDGEVSGPEDYKKACDRVDEAYERMYGEGYFRDSYNCSSLLNILGLSWWKDVGEHQDDDGNLNEDGLRWFKQELLSREITDSVEEFKVKMSDVGIKFQHDTPETWHEYFVKKRLDLLELIDLALEKGEPLYCST